MVIGVKIIGLTGQTGAGKSTVARALEKIGYYHIDADLVAKEVINGDKAVISALAREYGEDIALPDGSVDRKLLAKRAFSSKENTERLSEITHPAVVRRIKSIISKKEQENALGVTVDAIGLFESGLSSLCDINVCVVAPEEIRLERIINRDKISLEGARQRISAQKCEDFFLANADKIIKNYPPYGLSEQIKEIINDD